MTLTFPKVAKCYSKPVPANNQFWAVDERSHQQLFFFLNHQCEGARMLELSESNIHLNATATNKLQAIEMAASALEQAGKCWTRLFTRHAWTWTTNLHFFRQWDCDSTRYIRNPFDGEKNRCASFQFPQGIEWGEGNIAYVVIGIAARSDEHLALLRQLTHVLGDEETAAQLATLTDVEKIPCYFVRWKWCF